MRTQKLVKSNAVGEFKIYAKSRDVLVFSSANFEDGKKTITAEEFKAGNFAIAMIPKVTQLDEVVIDKEIRVGENVKDYTPAERRLRAGTKPARLNQGLEINNDAIINAISGKSKQLKKELEVERKQSYLEKLDDFSDEYYVADLGIPKDYVEGFKYYIIYDETLTTLLSGNDKVGLESQMLLLADEFKKDVREIGGYLVATDLPYLLKMVDTSDAWIT
ncbi:MAG: hypothetical protein EOO93_23475, partial [Pedobacter sp.]